VAFAAAREQLGHALSLAADDNRRASVLVALAEVGGNEGSWDDALAHLDAVDALADVDARCARRPSAGAPASPG